MISHSFLLRRGNVSDKSSRENQDTVFYVQCLPPPPPHLPSEVVPFMTKIFQTWKATDYNMKLAHCMLCTYDYKHTLRICNRSTYCFSTAAIVARTRLMLRCTYIACLVSLSYRATTYASKIRLGITKATDIPL